MDVRLRVQACVSSLARLTSSGIDQHQPPFCCSSTRREALRSPWLQINIINIDLSRLIAVEREYEGA